MLLKFKKSDMKKFIDDKFLKELTELINKYSLENRSNTPDFILARYLLDCLKVFDETLETREWWYEGNMDKKKPDEPSNLKRHIVNILEKKQIEYDNEYCQCEIPERESGFSYCYKCHKHVSDARMKILIEDEERSNK